MYPEEVDDFELLIARARRAVRAVPTFTIRLGAATAINTGAGPDCWQQLSGWSASSAIDIDRIVLTRTSVEGGMRVIETFDLA